MMNIKKLRMAWRKERLQRLRFGDFAHVQCFV